MFKPGDVVECVETAGQFGLEQGAWYEVAEATAGSVIVKEMPAVAWLPSRFRPVAPTIQFRRVLQYSTDGKTWIEVPPCP